MTTRHIIGIAALIGVSTCGMIASLAGFEMMDRVNERLSKAEQSDAAGWYLSKYRRLRREYRRLYPHGRLILKSRVLAAAGLACLLICAWSVGLFGR